MLPPSPDPDEAGDVPADKAGDVRADDSEDDAHGDSEDDAGMAATPSLMHARGVSHVFEEDRGVQDLDLDVPAGCIFGLVGPSGSGKTTIVRLVLGLLRAQAGTLEVFGMPPAEFGSNERERIGFLPQESALDPELSLYHNLQFMASLYGLPWRNRHMPGAGARAARERIDDLLELLDLSDRRGTRLRNASTGEQRRLAIAAALVHQPDLLVLDEPTAGIDPLLREELWERFEELRDTGTTLIVTTQYVTEADKCDLVGLVVDGSVLHVATPHQLRLDAFGGDLVEVTSDRDLRVGRLLAMPGVLRVHGQHGPGRLLLLVEDAEEVSARLVDELRDGGDEAATASAHRPSFDDVFVRLVRDHRSGQGGDRRSALARRRKRRKADADA